jgi:hypothetical protein
VVAPAVGDLLEAVLPLKEQAWLCRDARLGRVPFLDVVIDEEVEDLARSKGRERGAVALLTSQDFATRFGEERFDERFPVVPGLLRKHDVAEFERVDVRSERLRPLVAAMPVGLERDVLVLLEALRKGDVPERDGE